MSGKCLSFSDVFFTAMYLPFGIFYKKELELLYKTTLTFICKRNKCIRLSGKCLSFSDVFFVTMYLLFGIFYKKQLELLYKTALIYIYIKKTNVLDCPGSVFLFLTCSLQQCTFLSAFSTRNNLNFCIKQP